MAKILKYFMFVWDMAGESQSFIQFQIDDFGMHDEDALAFAIKAYLAMED